MWIIPKNHPLHSSAFAQECVGSKEELNELSGKLEHSLMWKQKHLLLKIWSNKWNKVYWIPHLFGRILKPSSPLLKDFEERWILSLEDTHASHFLMSVECEELKTQDTSGHISVGVNMTNQSLAQLDLFSATLKTSAITLISATNKSGETWKDLTTRLKKEYSQRKKLALLTLEKDYLSWPTPTATNGGSNNNSKR